MKYEVSFCLLKTCYLSTLSHVKRSPLHDGYTINRAFRSKNKIKTSGLLYMVAWSTVEEKFYISTRPCNILLICNAENT